LRELHRILDFAVAENYGWSDYAAGAGETLRHDFYDTKQGTRWTIHPEVRSEILKRLLAINHLRHEEEQDAANTFNLAPSTTRNQSVIANSKRSTISNSYLVDQDLFENALLGNSEGEVSPQKASPVERVYDWVEENGAVWISKEEILAGTGLDGSTLEKAISELVADEDMEQQGEGEQARYRVKD